MKVRKLIEMLAKGDWDAEARMDFRKDIAPSRMCDLSETKRIKSISSFTSKGKPVVTLNIR